MKHLAQPGPVVSNITSLKKILFSMSCMWDYLKASGVCYVLIYDTGPTTIIELPQTRWYVDLSQCMRLSAACRYVMNV